MSHAATSRPLRALAAHLAFALDDVEAAGRAFRCWREQEDAQARCQVDLWTYCFVRRYYLVKLARLSAFGAADFDLLVARTFRKIECRRSTVRHPGRYASWVSVVCKNTFINYLNRRRPHRSLDAAHERGVPGPAVEAAVYDDAGVLFRALRHAVARLPDYLQETARLRFIEEADYEAIAQATGRSTYTARSYVHKARERFRADAALHAYLDLPGDA